jgi:hypothetical protein
MSGELAGMGGFSNQASTTLSAQSKPYYHHSLYSNPESRYAQYVGSRPKVSSFNFEVITTLRGIFDSRYSDLVFHGSRCESIQDFSEYVHWWLAEYQIDKKSREIVKAESYQDEDYERLL